MECFGHVPIPRRESLRRIVIGLTRAKLQADGETPQFAGQVKEPGHHAQAHVPVWLEGLMSCQRHCADGHPQFPFGEEGLNLLNLAGRKPHRFCTVSAPLVRLRVVQFFGGGAVNLLDDRFQFGQTLTAGFLFLGLTTDQGVVEYLRMSRQRARTARLKAVSAWARWLTRGPRPTRRTVRRPQRRVRE